MIRILLTTILTGSALLIPGIAAQTQKPRFEVAAVRPNVSGAPLYRASLDFYPARFTATNVFLRWLIAEAYAEEGREPATLDHIVGGPSWVDSAAFDVQAATDGRATSKATMRLMLRTLLEDRFGLETRKEQRNLPAYALLPDRTDGRPGTQLRPAATKECADLTLEEAQARRCGSGVFFDREAQTTVAYGSDLDLTSIIEEIASPAVANLDRPVVDRTGLSGRFDYEVRFSVAAGRLSASPADRSGTSIFTALREQLGLKLEPVTAPVDVLVIESARQPAEN
jgi:uncharacterized protein (TIGR03435 family)